MIGSSRFNSSRRFSVILVNLLGVRLTSPAAGRGIGHRSRGDPELWQDHVLDRQPGADYQQGDEQVIHQTTSSTDH